MSIMQRSSSELPTQRVVEFRLLGSKFRTVCNITRSSFHVEKRRERPGLLTIGMHSGGRRSRMSLGYSRSNASEDISEALKTLTKRQPLERPYTANREYHRRSLSWQKALQLRPKLALRPAPRRVLLQVTGANLPRNRLSAQG